MGEFVCLGGDISAGWDLRNVEITLQIQRAWACFGPYKMEIYHRPSVRLSVKVQMLKAEAMETLLYGCVTRSLSKAKYREPKGEKNKHQRKSSIRMFVKKRTRRHNRQMNAQKLIKLRVRRQ